MEWSKRNEYRWESGPFTIELVAPKHWVLTRSVDGDHLVDHGDVIRSGPSLQRMKAEVELLASAARQSEDRRRTLILGASALFLVLIAVTQSGPVAATVSIGAVGVLLYALVKAMDHAISSRPWDTIGERYQ